MFRTFVFLAAGLAGSALHAQLDHGNDIRLHNGVEGAIFIGDPSVAGDYIWKMWPAEVMRSCDGTMSVVGIETWVFDTDFNTVDAGGNNTFLADMYLSRGLSTTPPGPDFSDPNGVHLSFGAGTPINNFFLTDPGCPPGQPLGYEIDISLPVGLPVVANGVQSTVLTAFIPGPGFKLSAGGIGGNACGLGDYPTPSAYSTGFPFPGGTFPEEPFNFASGTNPFSGYFWSGSLHLETSDTTWGAALEFATPTLAMHMHSNQGNFVSEGLHGIHYNCSPVAGGSLGARIYDWARIGRPAAVVGTISPPLASCVNFKGGKLGLNPTDPLFNLFLNVFTGTVVSNGEDGTFTTPNLGLPPQAVPVGMTILESFQGITLGTGGKAFTTQVTRLYLHG